MPHVLEDDGETRRPFLPRESDVQAQGVGDETRIRLAGCWHPPSDLFLDETHRLLDEERAHGAIHLGLLCGALCSSKLFAGGARRRHRLHFSVKKKVQAVPRRPRAAARPAFFVIVSEVWRSDDDKNKESREGQRRRVNDRPTKFAAHLQIAIVGAGVGHDHVKVAIRLGLADQ